VIITCILVIRQQITRKLEDYLDWVSVFNAIVAIITLIVFFIYQKKVIIGQNTAKHVAVIIGQNTAKHVAISKKNIDGVELPKHTSSSSTSRENEMVKHSVLVADAPTKLSKSKLDCSVDGDRVDDYDEFFYSECGEIVDLIDNNKIIAV
jgi:vacuolar-type H+-ATPase subunit D/Vma8